MSTYYMSDEERRKLREAEERRRRGSYRSADNTTGVADYVVMSSILSDSSCSSDCGGCDCGWGGD